MLRPLAVAVGLALCLTASSSAYAAKPPKILSKGVSWAWEYIAQEWSYKNGKVILSKPIEFDVLGKHFEQSEIDVKAAKPALFWLPAGYLWGPIKNRSDYPKTAPGNALPTYSIRY